MPQELSNPVTVTTTDNLRVDLRTKTRQIVCEWDTGYMDGETFVRVHSDGYVFEGEEYDTLEARSDFRGTETNYENVRRVMYAALRHVGKI